MLRIVSQLKGAARRSIIEWLRNNEYDPDWDSKHIKVSEYHQDEHGHVVCGCEIHQAWCPDLPLYVAED